MPKGSSRAQSSEGTLARTTATVMLVGDQSGVPQKPRSTASVMRLRLIARARGVNRLSLSGLARSMMLPKRLMAPIFKRTPQRCPPRVSRV